MLQQRPHVSIPLVHILHKQCPVVVRHAGKLGLVKRSGAQRPLVGGRIMAHQPSQRPLLARQPRQILRLDGRLETGKRPANQHRPLLPIVTQEALGRHAQGERPFGRIDFQRRQCRRRRLGHRRIILCRNHRKHFILPAVRGAGSAPQPCHRSGPYPDIRPRIHPNICSIRCSNQHLSTAPSRSTQPRHKLPPPSGLPCLATHPRPLFLPVFSSTSASGFVNTQCEAAPDHAADLMSDSGIRRYPHHDLRKSRRIYDALHKSPPINP